MEEVAISPMVVAALVLDNNGADAVSSTAIIIPSVTISLEEKEEINGDVPTITSAANNNDEELFNVVESTKYNDDGHQLRMKTECTTPVSRSPSSTRKKRGASSLFRAMFVSFGSWSDSMKKTDGDTTSPKRRAIAAAVDDHNKPAAGDESPSWKIIVNGMRPLRLRGQGLEYYPPPPPLGHGADVYHDVILPPPSPARSGFEFEEVGMTSRYASAVDLHQMDSAHEETALAAEDGNGDDSSFPHAIDMQAEEFIAKFYEQFKSESFDGRVSESDPIY